METTFNQMLESKDYAKQKEVIFKLINGTQENKKIGHSWFAPVSSLPYIDRTFQVDYSVFKKSDKEKEKLLNLKKKLPKTRNYKFKTYAKMTF